MDKQTAVRTVCPIEVAKITAASTRTTSHSDIGRALLIPVLGSQPADDMSHKPGGRLPLHSARPAVTLAILQRPDTNFGV